MLKRWISAIEHSSTILFHQIKSKTITHQLHQNLRTKSHGSSVHNWHRIFLYTFFCTQLTEDFFRGKTQQSRQPPQKKSRRNLQSRSKNRDNHGRNRKREERISVSNHWSKSRREEEGIIQRKGPMTMACVSAILRLSNLFPLTNLFFLGWSLLPRNLVNVMNEP